jgi:hypothetical protein
MAVRLQGDFYSEKGAKYTVGIYDSSFSGAATDFDATNVNIQYDFDGKDDDRFCPIVSSTATVTMMIDTSTLTTFIDDLVGAAEDRFYLLIEDDNSPNLFRWAGYILPDLVQIEDVPEGIGYRFNLKAKDGFNYLKSVDYKQSNGLTYTGYATIAEHLLNCINKIPFITDVYGSGNILTKVLTNWYEEDMAADFGQYVLFNRTRVNHRAFWYYDAKKNVQFRSAYDVLRYIAICFGGRFIFSSRYIYFIQVNEYLNPVNRQPQFAYATDTSLRLSIFGNEQLYYDYDHTDLSSNIFRRGDGVFQFYPALKEVVLDYEHLATRNITPGEVFSHDDSPQVFAALEDIDITQSGAFLDINLTVNYKSTDQSPNPANFKKHWLVFGCEFKSDGVGVTQYYSRKVTITSTGFEFSKPEWTTDSTARIEFPLLVEFDALQQFATVNFQILNLPSVFDYLMGFELLRAYDLSGNSISLQAGITYLDIEWQIENVYVEFVALGYYQQQNDIYQYAVDNDDFASTNYKTGTLIGQGPTQNSPGHLQIWDGSDWVQTTAWQVIGTTADKPIGQLTVNEIIKGQLKPVEYFSGMTFVMNDPVNNFLFPHLAIKYKNNYYVFQGGEINLMRDEFTGEWWKISDFS